MSLLLFSRISFARGERQKTKTDHIELLNRLEACVLDDSDAAFPFSRRLARDNGWTATYTRRNWILPKPQWYRAANNFIAGLKGMIPKGRALDAALVTVLIAAAGCGTVVAGGVSPFDYQGPEFLEFFVVAWGVGIAMAAWLRWKLRLPAEEPPQGLHKLDPYTIAYLSGGKERTVNAAIVALFNAKILKKHHCELRLLRSDPPLPNAHAFEQAVYAHVPEEGTSALTEFRTSLAPLLKTFEEQLKP